MLGDLSAFLNFLGCCCFFVLHRVPCLIPPKVHEVSRSETHELVLTAKPKRLKTQWIQSGIETDNKGKIKENAGKGMDT